MHEDKIRLNSPDVLAEFQESLSRPVTLNIDCVEYDPDSDQFEVLFDIGVLKFSTLMKIEPLEELINGFKKIKHEAVVLNLTEGLTKTINYCITEPKKKKAEQE